MQLSNVKQDPAVFKAQNDLAAAAAHQVDAIAKIGEAIRRNPEYRDVHEVASLKEIAATVTQKGTNTLIVVDGDTGGSWAQAVYAPGEIVATAMWRTAGNSGWPVIVGSMTRPKVGRRRGHGAC